MNNIATPSRHGYTSPFFRFDEHKTVSSSSSSKSDEDSDTFTKTDVEDSVLVSKGNLSMDEYEEEVRC